jgi:hypothetical protein
MSSRFNQYGSATATEIEHDIPSGYFDGLDRGGTTYITSLIGRYQNRQTYYVESNGHGKYSAKWIRRGGYWHGRYGLPAGNYSSSGLVLIGIFDSFTELQSAVDAALGYHYTTYFADYVTDEFDKVWTASYDYVNIWRIDTSTNSHSILVSKPCYLDLLNGYYLDKRTPAKLSKLKPKKTQVLEIGYYRENVYESVSGLRSIDWFSYAIDLEKDKPIYLPIEGCVLGTLWVSDADVKSQLNSMPNKSDEYPISDYFPEAVPSLFNYWTSLYEAENSKQLPIGEGSLIISSITQKVSSTIRILGANNNVWKNADIINDVGVDLSHPMFLLDEMRTFNYHFKPQSDGSFGDLVMDSPRVIELWNHFCSETPYENDIDKDKPRLDTLGKRLKRTSEILGYRLNANGEIDKKTEEDYTRHIVPPKARIDKAKYGGNSFGSHGMHIRRLPNHFDRNQIKDGGVVAIHDIGQLLLEILDQLNLALGIQEAGAIELKHEGKTHKYQNLLALTTDIAIHQFNQTQYAKSTHISSLVTQEQTKEIIGGLGLPTVAKTIRREVNGKVGGIPYWGIAPQASLARKIDTCTYNVGVVLGQML